MNVEDATRMVEPDEKDQAAGNLLSILAEGKAYVFLVAETDEDEQGEFLRVIVMTNVRPETAQVIMDNVQMPS